MTDDSFIPRHIGPAEHDIREMLAALGYATLDELIDATIPSAIRFRGSLSGAAARSSTASSTPGGSANALTGARGIVGSIAPPAAIAPNGTLAA
mgnify:CR=1 FL=1